MRRSTKREVRAIASLWKVRFNLNAETITFPIRGRVRRYKYKPTHGPLVDPHGKEDEAAADTVYSIARARGLAAQVAGDDPDTTVRWPVYWWEGFDGAMIFNGRGDGFVNVDELWADDVGDNVPEKKAVVGSPASFGNFSRKEAIDKLRECFWAYDHFGRVPGADEMLPLDECPPHEKEPVQRAVSPDRASVTTTASSVPASVLNSGIDRWIADTGCGHDLVQASDVSRFKRYMEPYSGDPVTLETANGLVEINHEIELRVHEIEEDVRACVLDATPAVLSVGRRCMDHGYGFYWPPGEKPTLVCPGGKVVHLDVDQYVPFVTCPNSVRPAVVAVEEAAGVAAYGSAEPVVPIPAADVAAPEAEAVAEEVVERPGRDLRAEAVSREHLMTHMPKNKYCPACQRAKMQHKPCRSGSSLGPVPESFGDQVTADHIVSRSEISQGLTGEKKRSGPAGQSDGVH